MNSLDKLDFIIKSNNTSHNSNNFRDKGYIVSESTFIFATSKKDELSVIHGELNKTSETIFDIIKNNYEKEKIYITAINNLLKQKKYLNLAYELSNDFITEEEFNEELEFNESQYLIKADDKLTNYNKIENLLNIINKINYDFQEDDLMEIFSISNTLIFNHKQINNFSDDKLIR